MLPGKHTKPTVRVTEDRAIRRTSRLSVIDGFISESQTEPAQGLLVELKASLIKLIIGVGLGDPEPLGVFLHTLLLKRFVPDPVFFTFGG